MRILFLQKRLLFPPNTGGKIRTLNVVRYLAQWHDLTYLCNIQPDEEEAAQQMRDLGLRLETIPWEEVPRGSVAFYRDVAMNLVSEYPFSAVKDYDPALVARAQALIAEAPYDLLICDFVQMARNAFELDVPAKLLFQHNVEAQIFERHAKSDASWARRALMRQQWKKMRRFESAAGSQFDGVVAVSPQDRAIFQRDYGWQHVQTIDTAVDVDYFQPDGEPTDSQSVVFVGSMDWLPNQDGVRFFVEKIWPLVREARPEAIFQIVGRNPTPAIRKLGAIPGVEVLGTVPDVRPPQREAAVVVVPLLVGGGTRLKIFEAMAMGKAIVSTALGAEGLPVTSGEHLEIVDEPAQFARTVIQLLEDPSRRAILGHQAREFVCAHYTAEAVSRQFDAICQRVAESAG